MNGNDRPPNVTKIRVSDVDGENTPKETACETVGR